MNVSSLGERRSEILRSLIQLHIQTGEPVGSESLSRLLNRSLSPATIRNILADLEALGYLDHPHTSAGRRPTDEGYRLYVDALMDRGPLALNDAAAIDSLLRAPDASPRQTLEVASRLLSQLSRQVAFVLVTEIARTSFRQIEFVHLAPLRVLVVMVTQSGFVTNKVIEVAEELSREQLQQCANFLNTHFAGISLETIRERLLEMMREEKALYDSLLQKVVALGTQAFAPSGDDTDILVDGTSHILEKPEFEDMSRMRTIFRTFEEKSRLVHILNACICGEGLRVLIGHENPAPDLKDMALVSASYPLDGEARWALGVLGSTRMEYARVMSLVDHVARAVTDQLRGETLDRA